MIAGQNLSKLNVRAAIEKAQNERAGRAELTADWVVAELGSIGGAALPVWVSAESSRLMCWPCASSTRDASHRRSLKWHETHRRSLKWHETPGRRLAMERIGALVLSLLDRRGKVKF